MQRMSTILPCLAAVLIAGLLPGLTPMRTGDAHAFQAALSDGPTPCRWVGRATKPPERLTASQFLLTMTVERALGTARLGDGGAMQDADAPLGNEPVPPGDASPRGEATVIVNSTYGASYYRPFDIKTGTALDVTGYVRGGGQCVVDTLNVGTLEPGFEGSLRPADACPTAGEETIAVTQRAAVPLGCAVSPMFTSPTPFQRFQGGVMLHLRGVYALQYGPAALRGVPLDGGTWSGARDTYREPEPAQAGLGAPPGLIEPRLGFGKVWRERYGGPDGPFGWALEDEATSDASWQLFERGIVVVTRAGEGLVLYHEGRVWEYRVR